MEVGYFLTERTSFVRSFYYDAVSPFLERQRLIENEEAPSFPPTATTPSLHFSSSGLQQKTR